MSLDKDIAHEEVTQGKYQLSIGTSLAFETLFGVNDNIPPTSPLPFKKYTYVLINLRTIIRNVYGAIQKELKVEWKAQKYLDIVLKELETIPLILDNQSHGQLSAVYYIPSYRSLQKKYPHAPLKGMGKSAYGRQHYEAIEQYCIAQLTAKTLREELTAAITDVDLPPIDHPAVIITHLPVDLLSYNQSKSNVDLIETHTGVIKHRRQWHTKLNIKNSNNIPFTEWSIQWFGDGKQFSGMPPKYKTALIAFAEKNRWNQTTTNELIKVQSARLEDKEMRSTLLKLL